VAKDEVSEEPKAVEDEEVEQIAEPVREVAASNKKPRAKKNGKKDAPAQPVEKNEANEGDDSEPAASQPKKGRQSKRAKAS